MVAFLKVKKLGFCKLNKELVLVFSFDVNLNVMHDKMYAMSIYCKISGKKKEN